jgi:cell division protein FtsW
MTFTVSDDARSASRRTDVARRRQQVLTRRAAAVPTTAPARRRRPSPRPASARPVSPRPESPRVSDRRAPRRKLAVPALPRVSLRPTPPPGATASMGPASQPTLAYYLIVSFVIMLTMIGLVMVLSASSITSFHGGNSPWRFFTKQALWAGLGAVAAVVAYRVPYQKWRAWTGPFMVLASGAMVLPFVPGLGRSVNSAQAWVTVGPVSFQPSEVLKVAVLMRCADLLSRELEREPTKRPPFKPVLQVLAVSAVLCLAQGDLGAVAVFGAIGLTVAFIAGVSYRPLLLTVGVVSLVFALFVFSSSRRAMRWTAFFDLEGNKEHYGYQVWQSVLSIANGGPSGVGIGAGTGKWGYVPLAHTDFIFAIVAEELGIIGALAVIGGFIVLTVAGIQVALAARDRFGMLLAGGIAGWFSVQALINVGGVTGAMPVTGLTLPLISYGGSSLLVSLAASGLLANVARHVK